MDLTLLVLAAGMGSRYGGLKQLDPIGPSGEAMLDYSVHDALQAGFTKVAFVIRQEFADDFRKVFGRNFERHMPVEYAFQSLDSLPEGFHPPAERERPWGTGHAVLVAKDVVQSPFVVINADDFYGRDSFRRIARHLRATPATGDLERYCMVGFSLKNTLSEHGSVARGLCECNGDGHLRSVTEIVGIRKTANGAEYDQNGAAHPLSGEEVVSLNFWGFSPSLFGHLERQFRDFLTRHGQAPKSEFYIPSAVDTLIHEGRAVVDVLTTESQWFGVTYREDRPRVQSAIQDLIQAGEYPERLWA